MSNRKKNRRNLNTETQTDQFFNYFVNEDKIDEQLRPEWNEAMEKQFGKRIGETNINLGEKKEDFPPGMISSGEKENSHLDFDNESEVKNEIKPGEFSSENSIRSSHSSIYREKILSDRNVRKTENAKVMEVEHKSEKKVKKPVEKISEKPILAERLVADPQKYMETPESKRIRQRDIYSKLQNLVHNYGVKLSRDYTIDSDPDKMEAEYDLHWQARNKNNQIKFYKNIFLGAISGIEFLNEKYDPFALKLKDWSKQIATDMDDYTEVLEELYEKYKSKGGKMAPEIRLIVMVITSAIMYHVGNTLFGSNGLGEVVKNNPNIIHNLMQGLMKNTSNEAEPPEAMRAPNSKDLLSKIKNLNNKKSKDTKSEDSSEKEKKIEKERKLLENQKRELDMQAKQQGLFFIHQMEELKTMQRNLQDKQRQLDSRINSETKNISSERKMSEKKEVIDKKNNIHEAEMDTISSVKEDAKTVSDNKERGEEENKVVDDVDKVLDDVDKVLDDVDKVVDSSSEELNDMINSYTKSAASQKAKKSVSKPKLTSATKSLNRKTSDKNTKKNVIRI